MFKIGEQLRHLVMIWHYNQPDQGNSGKTATMTDT